MILPKLFVAKKFSRTLVKRFIRCKVVLAEILEERVVSSRGRQIPRGVKRKMSNFPLRPRNASATGPVNYAKYVKVLNLRVPSSRQSVVLRFHHLHGQP